MRQMTNEELTLTRMIDLIEILRDQKSEDRTPKDRALAVCITDLEKVYAYYNTFVKPQ